MWHTDLPVGKTRHIPTGDEHDIGTGQRVNILLSDGTNVCHKSGSKMKYPVSFSRGKREISLDGEGYFEVAKNAERPFVMPTDRYNIEVLGTKFNVNAYNKSSSFSAALLEGSIQISEKNGTGNSIVLRPLQKVDIIENQLVVEKIHNYDIYRWKEGLLCFEHISFNNLLKDIRYTDH